MDPHLSKEGYLDSITYPASQFETHLSTGCTQYFQPSILDPRCCSKPHHGLSLFLNLNLFMSSGNSANTDLQLMQYFTFLVPVVYSLGVFIGNHILF